MSEKNEMDYSEWIAYGQENHWCSKLVCNTHTSLPITQEEDIQFSDGFDPCVYGVRIYEYKEQSLEAKENSKDG